MTFLSKLLDKLRPAATAAAAPAPATPDPVQALVAPDPLVPVPVPALGILLIQMEKKKGAPLSEQEVVDAGEKAVCIMLPQSEKSAMERKRGYADLDLDNVWRDWLAFRARARRPG
ncbi:MAG: hypothetical protein V4754_14265 [Pseudomonadota bacterium]